LHLGFPTRMMLRQQQNQKAQSAVVDHSLARKTPMR
jgi:hypothetical protein